MRGPVTVRNHIPLGARSGHLRVPASMEVSRRSFVIQRSYQQSPDVQRKGGQRQRKNPGGNKHGPPHRGGPFGPGRHNHGHDQHGHRVLGQPHHGEGMRGKREQHHKNAHRNHGGSWLKNLFNQLEGQYALGPGQGFGTPGATIIPPASSMGGGGVNPVIVIGGLSVIAVIALIVYEWYRHKHKKEEQAHE